MENGSGFLDQLGKYGPNGIIIALMIVFFFQLSGVKKEIDQFRTEIKAEIGQMRSEVSQLRTDLVGRIDRLNDRIDRHIESGNHSMALTEQSSSVH